MLLINKLSFRNTHPVCAALDDLRFVCGGKRVKEYFLCSLSIFHHPLSAADEARVVKHSDDRVKSNSKPASLADFIAYQQLTATALR
jgi:hypothetical protein